MWVTGDVDRALPILTGPLVLDGESPDPRPGAAGEDLRGGHPAVGVIRQGKNRQVRRMCALAGLEVTSGSSASGRETSGWTGA